MRRLRGFRSQRFARGWWLLLLGAVALLMLLVPPPTVGNPTGFTDPTGCFCHSASPDPSVTVELVGLPAEYDPLAVYPLAVSLSGGPPTTNGGFYLAADGGVFSDPGPHAQILNDGVTHTDNQARSWTVNWTAPEADSGQVTFSLWGNAVNGDGAANDADRWNSAQYVIQEDTSIPLIPSDLTLSLPASVQTGQEFTVVATLRTSSGIPVSGAEIVFSRTTTFGSMTMGNGTTDASGNVSLNYTLVAGGEVLVDVNFRGGRGYGPAHTSGVMVVEVPGAGSPPWLTGDRLAVLGVTLILGGIWGCYTFVAYQVRKISEEGKEQ